MSTIKFKSDDNKFSVEINNIILNSIKCECIIAKNKETGGILLGNYSLDNHNAIISSITGPPIDSKQSRNTFEIGIIGLNEIIDDNWKQGHYYIGDWHFHPNASPLPSIKDDIQMKKNVIDNLLKCSVPLLLIIGGNQDKGWKLSVQVYTKNGKISLKQI